MNVAAFRSALAGTLFLAATLAFSQDGGLYLAAGAMATFAGPHDFTVGPKPAKDADLTVKNKSTGTFDIGVLGFRATVGFRFFGFRPEAEISYRQLGISDFDYSSFSSNGDALADPALDELNSRIDVKDGHLILLAGMANLWFDVDTGGSPIMPFLGGGVGIGRVTLKGIEGAQDFPESSAEAFAFQAGAGVGFDLGAGFALRFGYRLFGTTETQLAWNAVASATDDVLQAEILLHNIDLGISYRF